VVEVLNAQVCEVSAAETTRYSAHARELATEIEVALVPAMDPTDSATAVYLPPIPMRKSFALLVVRVASVGFAPVAVHVETAVTGRVAVSNGAAVLASEIPNSTPLPVLGVPDRWTVTTSLLRGAVVTPYHSVMVDSWVVVHVVIDSLAEDCHVTAEAPSVIEETVTDELERNVTIHSTITSGEYVVEAVMVKVVPVDQVPVAEPSRANGGLAASTPGGMKRRSDVSRTRTSRDFVL
jgi:hypothetical protein